MSPRRGWIWGVVGALAAGLVIVAPTAPARAASSSFTFNGSGFGHGIGLSQYGAYGFAKRGSNYVDILRYYYSGTSVDQIPTTQVRIHLTDSAGPLGVATTGAIFAVDADNVASAAWVYGDGGSPLSIMKASSGALEIWRGGSRVFGPLPVGHRLVLAPESSPASGCHGVPAACVGVTAANGFHWYRWGQLELTAQPNGVRAVMRQLDSERYLYGLGEMPSSWPAEALRSQAVAGRTYLLEKQQRLGNDRPGCSCTLLPTTADQNYIGFDKEAEAGWGASWVAAVNATAGRVVRYGGQLIQAYYSSSSGGHTENIENVWGGGAVPYLRGMADADVDVIPASIRSWVRTYSSTDLDVWLDAATATAVPGSLVRIEVVGTGVSGRPIRLRLVGTEGSRDVLADTFRNQVNRNTSADLLSTKFAMSQSVHQPSVTPMALAYGSAPVSISGPAPAGTPFQVTLTEACGGALVRQYNGVSTGGASALWDARADTGAIAPPGGYSITVDSASPRWRSGVTVTSTPTSPPVVSQQNCARVDSATTREAPAIFRSGTWILGSSYATTLSAPAFTFGSPGDVAITGDWDGDGVKTIGVFRDGLWALRNSNTPGPPDSLFVFGQAGDVPVVGDWSGQGRDSIAIFRSGVWHIRWSPTPGPTDALAYFGQAGDVPSAGRLTLAPNSNLLIFRNGTWFVRSVTGSVMAVRQYGAAGDRPVVGDWEGNGVDGLGIVRGGTWALTSDLADAWAQSWFGFGGAQVDQPVVLSR